MSKKIYTAKIKRLSLLSFCLIPLLSLATPSEILLLNSYHQGLSWTDSLTESIKKELKKENISLDIEYLDSKRRSLDIVAPVMASYLKEKHATHIPSAIIATDNNALSFLKQYPALFPQIPVIFCGINDYSESMIKGLEKTFTGVAENTDPLGTVQLIQQLKPNTERIIFIAGETPTGQALLTSAQNSLKHIESVKFEWWTGISTKTLMKRLSNLGNKDAVILLVFNKDSEGLYHSNREIGEKIASKSPAPVFCLHDFYMNTGVIGGRIARASDQGRLAAKLCLEYLETGKIGPVIETSPNATVLNYPDLKRHKLHLQEFPPAAIIQNAPPPDTKYFLKILVYLTLFLVLTTGVFISLTWISAHKKVQHELMSIMIKKTTTIFVISSLCTLIVLGLQEFQQYKSSVNTAKKTLLANKKLQVQAIVDGAVNNIDFIRKSQKLKNVYSEDEIKNFAMLHIKNTTAMNLDHYLFITDINGRIIHHPLNNFEGQNFNDLMDTTARLPFNHLLSAALLKSQNFVTYKLKNPDSNNVEDKITYARHINQWNWIVAAGINMSDIYSPLKKQTNSLKQRLIYNSLGIAFIGFFGIFILLITHRFFAKFVAKEIKNLQLGIENKDKQLLNEYFSIKEFEIIAKGAWSAFTKIELEQNKFETLFQKNTSLMVITSIEEGISAINDAFADTFQIKAPDVRGKTLVSLGIITEELRDEIIEEIKKSGDSGLFEINFKNHEGSERKGEIRVQLLNYGEESHYLAVLQDVTDQQRAEDQAFQLSRAIEQSPVSVIITNMNGNIEYVNPKFCTVTGYSREEALDKNPRILKSGEQDYSFYEELWACISSGGKWSGELHNKRKDGTFFWEIAYISGLRDTTGKISHYLAIKEDITEKKALEGQLAQAQKLESVGHLAAGIAHEINTPIQFVGDNLSFLKDSIPDLISIADHHIDLLEKSRSFGMDEEFISQEKQVVDNADLDYLREELPMAIEQSIEGAGRVSKIVRAMKEFSHPGTSKMTPSELNKAIETTITVAKNEWKYSAELKTHFAENMPLIPCLVSEFNQVILNMIVNARDAIKETGTMGTISISTSFDDHWAIIKIDDTGAGMPQEVQDHIFDPFFTTKEVGVGSGQGLAIAHNVIVDKHKGRLIVKSEPNKGTSFIIKLPINNE